jgi:hypothetical protein
MVKKKETQKEKEEREAKIMKSYEKYIEDQKETIILGDEKK